MTRVIAILAVLCTVGVARADREQQAAELFQQRCGTCHVVGRGLPGTVVPHNIVDLTWVVKRHDDAWLRSWILSPHALKPKSNCYTYGLEPTQIDLLLSLLHARAAVSHPHARPQQSLQPPVPQDPPPPPQGMVRGR
jgi:hypothetical protein